MTNKKQKTTLSVIQKSFGVALSLAFFNVERMTNDDTERKRRQLEEEIGLYEKILNAHRKRHEQMNNDSDNVIQVSLADEYECIPDSQPSHDPSPSRVDESAKMSTLRHDDDGGDIAKDDICDNVNHITDYTRHARDVPNLSRGYPLTCRDVKLKFHRMYLVLYRLSLN